jgi:hypothetical protein
MKSIVVALLFTLTAPCLVRAQTASGGLVDDRPVSERKSQFSLESYRTQISLSDDSMAPSPFDLFAQAVQSAMGSQGKPVVVKSLGLRISIPPTATSAEVYRAMNVPDGPPNASGLVKAISGSLPQHPGSSALVVCEAEVVAGGNEYRALVRESYERNLTPEVLSALLKQAATELVADLKAAK